MSGRYIATLTIAVLLASPAQAHHKPGHHIPPGQMKKIYDPTVVVPVDVDFVCLVTTDVAGDPYSKVVYTEWLPRSEAVAKADLGQSFVIYHPNLNTEAGCIDF